MLQAFFHKNKIEAGCDEAGRGCLAGPVFAAAVVLPKDFGVEALDDSKKMTEKNRYQLRQIIEKEAIAWAVGQVSHREIDEINILNASFLAMHRALEGLQTKLELILVDGNRFKKFGSVPHECVIKGDGKYASIAAASVLAKTYRDDFMRDIHQKFPQYHWDTNKGYPTKAHRKAILEYGNSPHHRLSFKLLPDGGQLSVFDK